MINRSDKYEIELFYGYEESPYGIYHAFEAVGIDDDLDSCNMGKELAQALDCIEVEENGEEVVSDRFNYNSMFISLPQSTVDKIKEDAVKEYLEAVRIAALTCK